MTGEHFSVKRRPGVLGAALAELGRSRHLYLMLVPGLAFFAIFHYAPMYGVVMAFKDFSLAKGILRSPWAGLRYFNQALQSPYFLQTVWNTFIISLLKLFWGFPTPIILALLLNEVRSKTFKKGVQTVSYLPHFLSWVVLGGIIADLLSPETGPVNLVVKALGGRPVYFLASKDWFRAILVVSNIWRGIGWGAIVYLAALAGIDPQLYDAAEIDGAGRLQQTWYITLPSISGVIAILLILRLGQILNAGFEQIFVLYHPMVYEVADIIDTWVYRSGLRGMQYSLAAAVGLFKSVVGLILVVSANWTARRLGQMGISLALG